MKKALQENVLYEDVNVSDRRETIKIFQQIGYKCQF